MDLGYVHHSNALAFQQTVQVSTTSDGAGGSQIFYDEIAYTDSFASYDPLLNINLPRLQFSYEYVGSATAYAAGKQDHRVTFFCATNFVFTDWAGNKHPFENNTMCNKDNIQGSPPAGDPTPTSNVSDSSDGSFYQLNTTNADDMTVVAKNGTVYHFTGYADLFPSPNQPGPPGSYSQENAWDSRASSIVDTNGNTIHINTTHDSSGNPVYTIIDTIGRSVVVNSAGVSYNDSNGNPQQIELQTSSASNTTQVQVPLSCYYHGPSNGIGPLPTVQAVGTAPYQAPEYTQETITFPSPAGGSGQRVYTLTFDPLKKIIKVDYPTGGYTRYDYAGGQLLPQQSYVACSGGPPAQIANKYECRNASGSCATEDITTYQPIINTNAPTSYNQQMTVTDPLGQKEVHLFSTTTQIRTNPQETDVLTYSADGTLMRTVHKDYPSIASPGVGQYSYDITFPSAITTTLNDAPSPLYSVTHITNSLYTVALGFSTSTVLIDNPTAISTSDYGSTPSGGALLKQVSQQWEPTTAFTPPHILDRPQSSTTTDPATGLTETTTNGYDTVGNVTSVTKNGTNTGSYTTSYLRNAYGEVYRVIDPKGYLTQIGYADRWSDSSQSCVPANQSAYPTSITNALNQTTYYTYNACSGTVSAITDPNGAITSYLYEAQDRAISKTVKDGSGVEASAARAAYQDSAPETVTTDIAQDPSHSISTEVDLDGLGRQERSILLSDPNGPRYSETTYDALGRKASVSNPHYGSPATDEITYAYDVLNRPLLECNQDNGTADICSPGSSYHEWQYAGQITDIFDENRNHWQQKIDGLGQLVVVKEPDSSGNPTLETDYTYALGNLTTVSQKGAGTDTPRTRSFSYNGLSQLVSATNPETGQICYGTETGSTCSANGYDPNGNLIYKTDARGAVTQYGYDQLNRLISKSFSGLSTPTPSVTYDYDQGPCGTNCIGRLVDEYTGTQANPFTKSIIQGYDAMGRVVGEQQCILGSCTTSSPTLGYVYDLSGNTISTSIGNGGPSITISTHFDTANQLMSLTSSYSGTVAQPSTFDVNHPDKLFSAEAPGAYSAVGLVAPQFGIYTSNGSSNGPAAIGGTITYDNRMRVTGAKYMYVGAGQ